MKLARIWVVMDPTPITVLGDIFFETHLDQFDAEGVLDDPDNSDSVNFHDWHLGASLGPDKFRARNLTFYTEEAEARTDALGRMVIVGLKEIDADR
jgi:hypothetical protein